MQVQSCAVIPFVLSLPALSLSKGRSMNSSVRAYCCSLSATSVHPSTGSGRTVRLAPAKSSKGPYSSVPIQSVGAAIQSVRTAMAPAKPPVFSYSAPRFFQYSKDLVKLQPLLPLNFYIIFECTFMQPQNYGRAPHSAIDALPVTLGKGRAMPRGPHAVTLRRAGR